MFICSSLVDGGFRSNLILSFGLCLFLDKPTLFHTSLFFCKKFLIVIPLTSMMSVFRFLLSLFFSLDSLLLFDFVTINLKFLNYLTNFLFRLLQRVFEVVFNFFTFLCYLILIFWLYPPVCVLLIIPLTGYNVVDRVTLKSVTPIFFLKKIHATPHHPPPLVFPSPQS